jgi:hypothetical protein
LHELIGRPFTFSGHIAQFVFLTVFKLPSNYCFIVFAFGSLTSVIALSIAQMRFGAQTP